MEITSSILSKPSTWRLMNGREDSLCFKPEISYLLFPIKEKYMLLVVLEADKINL